MARTIQTTPRQMMKRDSSLKPAPEATGSKKKQKRSSSNASSTAFNEAQENTRVDDDDQPDPKEWDDPRIFKPYRSFRRNDGGPSSIHVGEYVHILGDHEVGVAPTNVRWVGQVQGVRAKSPNEVYMKVKWCYNTIAQLKESGIPLPRGGLAENEVIISPFEDIVSVWSVEGQASVRRFDEEDPWQEAIASDDEYYRSEIKEDSRHRRKVVPYRSTPRGEKPYRPLPYGSTPMTYCPREGCQKWHHQGKLKKIAQPTDEQLAELAMSGLETLTLSTRPKAASDPEETETNTNPEPSGNGDGIPSGRRSGSNRARKSTNAKFNNVAQTDTDLELIRRFVESSITRGDYSIVGNARSVLEAREIMSMKERDPKVRLEMMKSWKENHVPVEDEEEPKFRWTCPKCKGII